MCNINIYMSADDACKALAQRLADMATKGGTVALSGGSTPRSMFHFIAEHYCDVDWSRMKFFWGDERMVPVTSDESNYGEFRRVLVDTHVIPVECCFPFISQGNEHVALRDAEQKIRRNVPFRNRLPSFDLIILGIGDDGHTASIFPDNMQSFTSPAMVEMVSQPLTGQRRITLTGHTINNARDVAMLCVGDAKREIINEIVYKKNHNLPASHVQPKGTITWYLDEAAAGRIR